MELSIADLLAAYAKSVLFVVAGVLPIINPLATAPIFVSLTGELSEDSRLWLARRVGRYVMVLLMGAMLIGSYVLHIFGISLPVVRVAGGLIVASIAWNMLHAQSVASQDATSMAQSLSEEKARINAFYPLTFPLTFGPGTIAVSIAIGASLHVRTSLPTTIANMAGGLTAAVLLGLLATLTFRYAPRLLRMLGETGKIVFLRLMAFVLLCVGVEILWDGVRALLVSILPAAAG
ncbi:MarC family protein [Melaminivora jejuensis]|uniref:MarC family protein n=1 Tax=Melaminivora jejuensis TaxID=1267217 RepID=UPI001AE057E7|nr:MarC family protein [Melaminivora jejuensis]UHJ65325.1 NAAT family transporter [Melaminivora jejuensis]